MSQDKKERMKLLKGLQKKLNELKKDGKGGIASQNVPKKPKRVWVKKEARKIPETPQLPREEHLDTTTKGKVKWYSTARGLGFIVGEDEKEYFFHHSEVSESTPLYDGDKVEFSIGQSPKGLKATNVIKQEHKTK